MWLYLRQELALHRNTFTEQQNISAVEYILNIYVDSVHYKWFIIYNMHMVSWINQMKMCI